jgi:murein DD-endopeptidase MepM/ murein hydrolase activator NlpD
LALSAFLWYIPLIRRLDGVLYRLIQLAPNPDPSPGVSSHVSSRRYTVVIADRTTGVVRRFTVGLRSTLTAMAVVLALPVLIGLGARWSALAELSALRTSADSLRQENDSFRAMTAQLTEQVSSVQTAVADLSAKAALDPESARALAKLPPAVRSRAMAGGSPNSPIASSVLAPTLVLPEDTFGTLREVLGRLGNRLEAAQLDLGRRSDLLGATPSVWPAQGPLSATFGSREDPFGRGGSEMHTGLDISGERGQPVFATAGGVVEFTGWHGDYGNMVTINHSFGMVTRYAHLSTMLVRTGDRVERGQTIGQIGATGRVTGPHLHYELLVYGKLADPLPLMTAISRR